MRKLFVVTLAGFGLFLIAAGSPSCPNQQWVARYTAPGFGVEEALDMVVDASGNTFLVGTSDGVAITIKYNVNGDQVWATKLDIPASVDDANIAIALDAAGNVYLTGGSYNAATSSAFTAKLSSGGQQQWMTRYTAPGGAAAAGADIALDAAGNVYVLGITAVLPEEEPDNFEDLFEFNFVVLKYTAAGQQAWVKTYDGPAKGFDYGTEIAVDSTGNAYIVGATQTGTVDLGDGLEFPRLEMLTAKYSPAGQILWQKRSVLRSSEFAFSAGNALAIDAHGNVVVTGMDGLDLVTIKYTPGGGQSWLARSAGGGGSTYSDVVLDALGNTYVAGPAGDAFVVYKYGPTGQEQWSATYGVGGFEATVGEIATDDENNLYLVGDGDGVMHTVKYAPDGKQIWAAKFEEPDGSVTPVGIGIDAQDSVFVGASGGGFQAQDALIAIRYSQGAP